MTKIITSESVNIGHPDKTCDFIADSFLDAALCFDPNAQMAVECAIKDDLLMIYGEATTTAKINYVAIARQALCEIGYKNKFKIIKKISRQSPEINRAVVADELKANDQGIVYGYATNETPEFMPLPIIIAHKLMKRYEDFRKENNHYFPDAKSQVSIEYQDNRPVAIHTVLVSVSHDEQVTGQEINHAIQNEIIKPVLFEYSKMVKIADCQIIINPSGAFTIWGSFSDSGCVGRKIIVDTYGGVGRHGGGAFSSKNATKIDRSGAYYCRFVAKNIIAAGFADRCEVSASYAIGIAEPLKVNIETFGTEKVAQHEIILWVAKNFDFRPSQIIKQLDLTKPIYKKTACYGHFGRDEFTWEKILPGLGQN